MSAEIKKITFEQAKEIMDRAESYVILDVREEMEYVTGHAEGAKLLPVDEIDDLSASDVIPTMDTPVFTYCRSGKRALMAAEKLMTLGYEHVYSLGSLVGWPYGISYDPDDAF